MGPRCVWPRVYPHCKWPRVSLITVVKPNEPITIIKHWHGIVPPPERGAKKRPTAPPNGSKSHASVRKVARVVRSVCVSR